MAHFPGHATSTERQMGSSHGKVQGAVRPEVSRSGVASRQNRIRRSGAGSRHRGKVLPPPPKTTAPAVVPLPEQRLGPRFTSPDEIKAHLGEFATYACSLRGDEKGEAQLFLDRLFRALGHVGLQEAGATLEFRIAKRPGSPQLELFRDGAAAALGDRPRAGGGKKFADLLWPERVLIEMKRRGEHLERHYDQLFDYWTQIVPHRPPYAVLCNFDELWVYDFNVQLFDPVDRLPVRDLAERFSSLGFLFPNRREPVFNNNRVRVTRRAAAQMAGVFRTLVEERHVPRPRAQRFLLQLLVALVSEDLGLLPDNVVTRLLADALKHPSSSYDLIGGLFRQMNTRKAADGGRYAGVGYFNGGLFAEIDPIELKAAELHSLEAAAREDWSDVKPEIFGTLFEQSMDRGERHAHGAHYTSEFDIQKVVGPTIVRPWRERIAAAGNRAELRTLLGELRRFRVLDPACGSGNFLHVAYREMKRLERDLLVRLRDRGEPPGNLHSGVALTQFFGIDKAPFAVELARVTLMLAKELELAEAKKFEDADGLLLFEKPLPLDNLDEQIVCADALFSEWPKADAIIGNPPYLGSRYLAKELGYDYTQALYERFPGVPKMADFCTHWFRLAHDALPPGGRAGLVGTNTVRQNESREASLDYVVAHGGTITEAVSTEVWSGDAAVHVSIVNWVKGEAPGPKKLLTQTGDHVDSPWRTEEVERIGPTLKTGTDVSGAVALKANQEPKQVFVGQYPFNEGFLLTPAEAVAMIKADARNCEVLFPYMIGRDLVEAGGPTRWIIDFGQRDTFEARAYTLPFERVKERVMPDVLAHAERERAATGKESTRWTRLAKRWWQFRDYQPGTMAAIAVVPRYVACSRVTKRPIFEFVSRDVHPDNTVMVFPMADDYSFGILQAAPHFEWFKARCSTLEGRFRYTSDTVFDTFPWPQAPTAKAARAVAEAAVALRALRREVMSRMKWSLRDLYRTLDDPGDSPLRDAHARLDAAVAAAYAMPAGADTLAFLLALNADFAARERASQPVTPPGLPVSATPDAAARAGFTTGDAVKP